MGTTPTRSAATATSSRSYSWIFLSVPTFEEQVFHKASRMSVDSCALSSSDAPEEGPNNTENVWNASFCFFKLSFSASRFSRAEFLSCIALAMDSMCSFSFSSAVCLLFFNPLASFVPIGRAISPPLLRSSASSVDVFFTVDCAGRGAREQCKRNLHAL